jgi:hypothetical protein
MTDKWTAEAAWAWLGKQPWWLGFNYVPSTAVNTTEFWQAATFDLPTIRRELGWAADAGFNACRVFIQELVWEADPRGFEQRFDRFLGAAAEHGIGVMPTLFDDCAFNKREPFLGQQEEPLPGRMMTSWTASPGHARVLDRAAWPALQRYVEGVVRAFGRDPRVVMWDLYNEPGNEGMGDRSLPLVEQAFVWARRGGAEQPLTISVWNQSESFAALNAAMLEGSDVVSFHLYGPLADTEALMDKLQAHGRPVVCTEWMARPLGSRITTHLPVFRQRGVGCFVWGLVNGRTQTHIPWEFLKGKVDKTEWFHDLFHADGKPYAEDEIALLRRLSSRKDTDTAATPAP